MKYYKLTKDLPTFKRGQMFHLNEYGSLVSDEVGIVAYSWSTIAKFPNILKDWFEEVPAPERDSNTKQAFMDYISNHKQERFFQAVRNFAREYLGDEFSFIYASENPLDDYVRHYDKFQDTFPFECDAIHNLLKDDDEELMNVSCGMDDLHKYGKEDEIQS